MSAVLVVCPSAQDKHILPSLALDDIQFHFLECDFLETAPPRLKKANPDLLAYCQQAVEYAVEKKVQAVFSSFDVANLVAAVVSKEIGKTGADIEAVFQCYHKYYTHQALGSQQYHLLQFSEDGTLHSALPPRTFAFPAYVKPACLSYGLLGQVVNNEEELLAACRGMVSKYAPWWNLLVPFFKQSIDQEKYGDGIQNGIPFVVEKFIQADAVTCDGYVYNGKVTVLGIVDTVTDKHGAVDCYRLPSQHSNTVQQAILEKVREIVATLGLDQSFFSIEFWLLPDNTIQVLEVNGRMSSTFRNLYLHHQEYDLYASAVRLACGQQPTAAANGKRHSVAGRVYLSTYRSGLAETLLDFNLFDFFDRHSQYPVHCNVAPKQSIAAEGFHPIPLAELDLFAESSEDFAAISAYCRNLLLKEKRSPAYEIDILLEKANLQAGEGILWDDEAQRLLWIDYAQEQLVTYAPERHEVQFHPLPVPAYSVAKRQTGELLLAGSEGLYLWKMKENVVTPLATEYQGRQLAFNDIVTDSCGRIYGGTIDEDSSGIQEPGALYLIDQSDIHLLDHPIGYSNGLTLSANEDALYFQDSAAGRIYRYAIDHKTGMTKNKQMLAQASFAEGILDGITLDSQGHLWSTLWNGGQIVCRSQKSGAILHRIFLPVPNITSLTFGGVDRKELYITVSAIAWPACSQLALRGFLEMHQHSAPLFRVRFDS